MLNYYVIRGNILTHRFISQRNIADIIISVDNDSLFIINWIMD